MVSALPKPLIYTLLLSATLLASQAQAGSPDNYAECVIARLNPSVPAAGVIMITSDCRKQFSAPSSPGLFGPSSTWKCYHKHEHKANNRKAAEALYGACADYFRKTSGR